MKKLINAVDAVVREQLMGMAAAHPELKVRIEPHYITRADSPVMGKVALVSGGGSGHEPMHGGLVGKGMLDGACPGEIFTSPTPDQMYECGQAVDGGAGVLFLVKNYTGDVLNFETAVELLHGDGVKVGFSLIDDDVAVKDSLYTAGRRGVATTVLCEKLVGAAAEAGYDLAHCEALARRINNQSRTIGVAMHACTVPAAGKPSFTLADNEMEFGVGIHGEPGIARRPFTDLNT
ncbi:dihydroxyacetone kinase subunit DhaK, partial [Aeromonas salmonicida]